MGKAGVGKSLDFGGSEKFRVYCSEIVCIFMGASSKDNKSNASPRLGDENKTVDSSSQDHTTSRLENEVIKRRKRQTKEELIFFVLNEFIEISPYLAKTDRH